MKNCPVLLHENDEYIPRKVFLEGIEVYMGLLRAMDQEKE